jgi:Tfp pilus assembly protein PilN
MEGRRRQDQPGVKGIQIMNVQIRPEKRILFILAALIAVLVISMKSDDSNGIQSSDIDHSLPKEVLLETALALAKLKGMTHITEQVARQMPQGEWLFSTGVRYGIDDPDLPVFVLAVRGEGVYDGIGGGYYQAANGQPLTISGLTVAIDARTGIETYSITEYIDPYQSTGQSITPLTEFFERNPEMTPEPLPAD